MGLVRIAFLGTPAFAVPCLRALSQRFSVVGVVTQPDRPAGRGRRLQAPPVKLTSRELGLPLIQPEKVGSEEAQETLRGWAPDVIVVAAYGQILRPLVLDLPPFGCINVHASLLPRWRGASPVQHALLHGDQQTGTTLMKMDAGLDTGPILARRSHPIRVGHTAASLEDELAEIGARLIVESLPAYFAGDLQPVAQDEQEATYAPRLKHTDGRLDPGQTAEELQRRVRALNPRPGTYLPWDDLELAVLQARAAEETPGEPPGAVAAREGYPALATARGWLILEKLQLPGKKPMDGKTFLRGQPHLLGAKIATAAP